MGSRLGTGGPHFPTTVIGSLRHKDETKSGTAQSFAFQKLCALDVRTAEIEMCAIAEGRAADDRSPRVRLRHQGTKGEVIIVNSELRTPAICGAESALRQRQVHVFNGFVNFGGAFVAEGDAAHARGSESIAQRGLAILALGEVAFSHQLHADHAHARFANFLHVLSDFIHIARAGRHVILRVHGRAFVIHPNHGQLQPLVRGALAQGRQSVHRGAAADPYGTPILQPDSYPTLKRGANQPSAYGAVS